MAELKRFRAFADDTLQLDDDETLEAMVDDIDRSIASRPPVMDSQCASEWHAFEVEQICNRERICQVLLERLKGAEREEMASVGWLDEALADTARAISNSERGGVR